MNNLEQFSKISSVKDESINKILMEMITKPYYEETGKAYNDSVNIFSNRLGIFASGVSYFHHMNGEFLQRFEKLEADIATKVDSLVFKLKAKKTKKNLRNEVSD